MAWKVFAAVLVVAGLAWGTYNVVVVLAHEERVETESFPAASLRAIDVRNSAGSVRVLATDGETVDVRAEISDGLRSTGERREIVGDVLELRGSCPSIGSDFCRVDVRDLDAPDDGARPSTPTTGRSTSTGSADRSTSTATTARSRCAASAGRCGCRPTTDTSRAPT